MKFDVQSENLIIKPYKNEKATYVREQKGRFQRMRRNAGWFLMLLFVLIPWIPYHGRQAVLLDFGAQQFHIFSITFFPQDLTALAALFMVGAFALFFITTWLGRIWCGFLCPQTVWMFMYIWVEEKVEGSRNQRIKLDNSPMSWNKFKKKATKHSIWLFMSLLTSLTFMSYFIPAKSLYVDLFSLEWSSIVTFWVALFAMCTYGNAGFLREKMCIYMCPYSRFQSAMFDKNTMLIAYDADRGESRGRRKRNDDPKALSLGDCVDCNLCVEVCPAGIDIRNGLQYECISCAACVDACDQTMERFNYNKGLISFTSENALAGNKVSVFRPKILAYASITTVMVCLMAFFVATRVPIEANILRDRTVLYRTNFDGSVENSYQLKLTNKQQFADEYTIRVAGMENASLNLTKPIAAGAHEMVVVPFTITVPEEAISKKISELELIIENKNQEVSVHKPTRFYSG
ncbi:cytochrome c oxidase accessory protein CcoG [Thalassotalea marina]|uniref:Cytochrome c oxidase accessory protein CcoG n=1 Tax=Thalassotalea marina TaxID=1673741 RepID=A0A919BC66_9GAMM|nr:cytochrome c oxidase accessory protein CcoG [Thalassotalea marina]GHF78362.1 cytochrome c oxidase accessory protein CcoG [Thalassotalea marina]